jgi:hypothetical protein
MADLNLTISEPVSAIVSVAGQIAVAAFNLAAKNRETASEHSKDEMDRIMSQIYWDLRAVLKFFKIVGEPEPWPKKP